MYLRWCRMLLRKKRGAPHSCFCVPHPQKNVFAGAHTTRRVWREGLKKAGVGEPEHIRQGGCGERASKGGCGRAGAHTTRRVWREKARVWERGRYFLSAKLGGCFDAGVAEKPAFDAGAMDKVPSSGGIQK